MIAEFVQSLQVNSVMYDQQIFANNGMTARTLLILSIPLLFVVLRSLCRWRKEHRLVCILV